MGFQIIKPSPILSPYIKHYWMLENCLPIGKKHIQRIVPNGFTDITFYFQQIPEYIRNKQVIKSNNIINGQQNSFYDIFLEGNTQLLSVVFQPYGSKAFFNLPISEFCNQSIPAEFIWKNDYAELNSKLQDSQSNEERIKLIEQFLINQLKSSKEFEINRIAHSINKIKHQKGNISINHLASETCLSEKQFNRTFSELVGISPKRYMRIVRFQNALYTKQTKSIHNLTELAYECGYFDQSHMINDFNNLSGLTPKQYFSECEPYSDFFS